ncbi:MAG: hypothetical protein AB3N16_11105 [Flavobacteriaceae bacterium]
MPLFKKKRENGPEDQLVVEDLISNGSGIDFLVINKTFEQFDRKSEFPICLLLKFIKSMSPKDELKNYGLFNQAEFQLRDQLGMEHIIFNLRMETISHRVSIYYISRKAIKRIKVNLFTDVLGIYDQMELTFKKDPTWTIADEITKRKSPIIDTILGQNLF